MRKSVELGLRLSELREKQSELRSKINAAKDGDDTSTLRTDAVNLDKQIVSVEKEYREAVKSEEDKSTVVTVDTQQRELRDMRQRCNFGRIIQHIGQRQSLDGVEAELLADCRPGHFPIDLFDVGPDPRETRAVTSPPNLGATDNQPIDRTVLPTIPVVFAASAFGAFGGTVRGMGPGQLTQPKLASGPTPAKLAKGTGVTQANATYGTTISRAPERGLVVQVAMAVEDLAVYPDLDRDLRSVTMAALSDGLDNYVFANATSDLFTQATDVTAESNTLTWASYITLVSALVDGDKHVRGYGDIRMLLGTATFAKLAATFPTAGDNSMSLWDWVRGHLAASVVSSRVPAAASNAQKALIHLTGQGLPPYLPTWGGIETVVDPYTNAGKGEMLITYTLLSADPVIPYGTDQVKELHPKIA
ncbi:MAG: hypothetical protein F4X11_03145 [Acidobacteria bacterium]|nr:hypothetical protein [Acidobacteriota bacterium]